MIVEYVSARLKQMKLFNEEKERKKTIAKIRVHLSYFGLDTTDKTDEEIEIAVAEFGKLIGQAGITVNQAKEGIELIGWCWHDLRV